jgi:hypothetical protein
MKRAQWEHLYSDDRASILPLGDGCRILRLGPAPYLYLALCLGYGLPSKDARGKWTSSLPNAKRQARRLLLAREATRNAATVSP